MVLNTHLKINESLNGELIQLKKDYAKIELEVIEQMVADDRGLVHGGFIFGAADYAAMAAINHPNVVLAKSEVKFLAPSKLGQKIILEARVIDTNGSKATVEVIGSCEAKCSFKGTFYTVTLDKHILDI
jgi:acyl-coenzyme A thioesterase PaaI-like protein